MAPVATVAEVAGAAAAGAQLADAGRDGALVPAIRRVAGGMLACGEHETADVVRDPDLAARTGAVLICPGPDAATAAVRRGIAAGRILVQAGPAGIEAAGRAGWAVLAGLGRPRPGLIRPSRLRVLRPKAGCPGPGRRGPRG
jgi:hypothetical protein